LKGCVSGEELSRWLRKVDAGEMALVVDACHPAASVEQPWFKPGPMGSRGLGQLAYDKRMRVLAASQADDVLEPYSKAEHRNALLRQDPTGRQAGRPKGQAPLAVPFLHFHRDRIAPRPPGLSDRRVGKRCAPAASCGT
jgi:hypothetical protein